MKEAEFNVAFGRDAAGHSINTDVILQSCTNVEENIPSHTASLKIFSTSQISN
jgi:hypothetical protein